MIGYAFRVHAFGNTYDLLRNGYNLFLYNFIIPDDVQNNLSMVY